MANKCTCLEPGSGIGLDPMTPGAHSCHILQTAAVPTGTIIMMMTVAIISGLEIPPSLAKEMAKYNDNRNAH